MERAPTAEDVMAAWDNWRHPWDFQKHPVVKIPLNTPLAVPPDEEMPPVRVRHAEVRSESGKIRGRRAARLIGTVPGTYISVVLETRFLVDGWAGVGLSLADNKGVAMREPPKSVVAYTTECGRILRWLSADKWLDQDAFDRMCRDARLEPVSVIRNYTGDSIVPPMNGDLHLAILHEFQRAGMVKARQNENGWIEYQLVSE